MKTTLITEKFQILEFKNIKTDAIMVMVINIMITIAVVDIIILMISVTIIIMKIIVISHGYLTTVRKYFITKSIIESIIFH